VVDLLRRYSNHADLLHELNRVMDRLQDKHDAPALEEEPDEDLSSACHHPRQRLLSVRFTSTDIAAMIDQYRSGATIHTVATAFQISTTSLKLLIREHGARRKDQRS
jgi:hypothetical protein